MPKRRIEHDLRRKALEMRNAIDMIEGAMMGFGNVLDIAELFADARDELILTPQITVGQLRRVVSAVNECNRIINADEFTPEAL